MKDYHKQTDPLVEDILHMMVWTPEDSTEHCTSEQVAGLHKDHPRAFVLFLIRHNEAVGYWTIGLN